jgi:pyruvate/2-oxoglutarate/acetoin dehydrogenase E1 component
MTTLTYGQALVAALHERIVADSRLNLFGTSFLLGPGAPAPLLRKLRDDFSSRNHDAPISESALALLAGGAAMSGARMFVHFGRATFALEAWSQICGEIAIAHYTSGGQLRVPLVMHGYHGVFPVESAQHCGSPQAMLWNCPGLQIALPSTPADAKLLLTAALASDNPTFMLSHTALLPIQEDVTVAEALPWGRAAIRRPGRDVTVVATSRMVHVAMEAAAALAGEGIEAEVIDPRTLVPFDWDTVLASVARTRRLVVVDETHRSCGVAAEIAATVAERAFASLKAPIVRVVREDEHVPYSNAVKAQFVPGTADVVAAIRRVVASGRARN